MEQSINIKFITDNLGNYAGVEYHIKTEKGINLNCELDISYSILDFMKMFIEYFETGTANKNFVIGDDFSSSKEVLSFNHEDILVLHNTNKSEPVKVIINSNEELKQNIIDVTYGQKEDWIKYFNYMFGDVLKDKSKANKIIKEFNALSEKLLEI